MIDEVNSDNENYRLVRNRFLVAVDLLTPTANPRHQELIHHRVIQADIFSVASGKKFLSLSCGNFFTNTIEMKVLPNNELNLQYRSESAWIRKMSQIGLSQHLDTVARFVSRLRDANYKIQSCAVQSSTNSTFRFRNGDGVTKSSFPKSKLLLRHPLELPQPWEIHVICQEKSFSVWRTALVRAFQALFPMGGTRLKHIRPDSEFSGCKEERALGLVVLDEGIDLDNSRGNEYVQELESSGSLFRLVRSSTLQNVYAPENLAYDMFVLAGGVPWQVFDETVLDTQYLAFDAGHLHKKRTSRWVGLKFDGNDNRISVIHRDTELAAHLSRNFFELVMSLKDPARATRIFRDGRFLKEATWIIEMLSGNRVLTS